MHKKILLSGIKPTGKAHIGNYFGALKQWVDLQDKYDTHIFIPSYHALTERHDAQGIKTDTYDLVLDLLGIGIDPEKTTIFLQQDVPEHTELSWIFSCITTMPYLMRAHAFKDAEAKNKEISVGTFNYPVLMAADILMYDTELVPVGKDQQQHVEIAREIGRKFNNIFGETFPVEPQDLIVESMASVPGTDGQKMSKSYKNTIPLFGTDDEIKKAVMSIVTDSSGDVPTNVYAIHKLFKSEAELLSLYEEKKGKYKDLKEALLADILAFVTPMRECRAYYESRPELVAEILAKGGAKAKVKAQEKMQAVRKIVGLI
jgi:tryptophanyl-tRNA synthetase